MEGGAKQNLIVSRDSALAKKRTGNIAKRRLFVNPYGPEIQTEFCYFSRGKWPEFGKKEVFTNPLPTAMFPILLPRFGYRIRIVQCQRPSKRQNCRRLNFHAFPRGTKETNSIAVKRLRCGVASEALRRKLPLSSLQSNLKYGWFTRKFANHISPPDFHVNFLLLEHRPLLKGNPEDVIHMKKLRTDVSTSFLEDLLAFSHGSSVFFLGGGGEILTKRCGRISPHPAAKGGRQKGIGKNVTKSVKKSDEMVTKRWPKQKKVTSRFLRPPFPKGPYCTKNSTAVACVVFCYRRSFLLSIPFLFLENKKFWALSVAFCYRCSVFVSP